MPARSSGCPIPTARPGGARGCGATRAACRCTCSRTSRTASPTGTRDSCRSGCGATPLRTRRLRRRAPPRLPQPAGRGGRPAHSPGPACPTSSRRTAPRRASSGTASAKRVFDAVLGRAVIDRASRLLAVSEAERRATAITSASRPGAFASSAIPVDRRGIRDARRRGAFRAAHGLGDGPLVVFLGKLTPRKRRGRGARRVRRARHAGRHARHRRQRHGRGRRCAPGAPRGSGSAPRARFTGLAERRRIGSRPSPTRTSSSTRREHEIFGLVPLEALLCGTPVVVAGDSGCGEVVVAAVGGGSSSR